MEYPYLYQFLLSVLAGFFISLIYFHDDVVQQPGFSNLINFFLNTGKVDDEGKNIMCAESKLQNALSSQIKLLCFVTTSVHRLKHQRAILDTWAPRCDTTLFIMGRKKVTVPKPAAIRNHSGSPLTLATSSIVNNLKSSTTPKAPCIEFDIEYLTPTIKMVYFDMVDVYGNLWQKTKLAFQYIVDEEKFDWVLKVDDDSFVIIDNLRLFLSDKDPTVPSYYGFHYKPQAPKGFNSGGPGYVLSRQNAAKFVDLIRGNIKLNGSTCHKDSDAGPEDVYIANCLYGMGIIPNDTRDDNYRYRFMPINLQAAVSADGIPDWFWGLLLHSFKPGFDCCSDSAISYHYISPEFMRVMEYLIYYLHPFSSRTTWRRQSPRETELFDRFFNLTNATSSLNVNRTQGCVRIHS